MGKPSVYPTGVTIYNKDKAWNGYTLFKTTRGAMLIDMNGRLVKYWEGLLGFPHKLLPGGHILGYTKNRDPQNCYQDSEDMVQCDWDGNIEWSFNKNEYLQDPGQEPRWYLRHHHDMEREGSTVGYYYPGCDPKITGGNTIILTHTNVRNPKISDKLLIDDRVIEVTWDGEIVWDWKATDHFDEFGFDGNAKNALFSDPTMKHFKEAEDAGDWFHINCVSTLGPNKWYDAGDERFHPDNLIMDGREVNIMFIVSKETGKIVWKLGPNFDENEKTRAIGQIIGQHHCHMIPRGLPGEGNILLFDNGGFAGYGIAGGVAPTGHLAFRRHYSRVLEIDPAAMEIVWHYPKSNPDPDDLMGLAGMGDFISTLTSSAQRLPNGNTMIVEGLGARMIEVTPEYEIVWEYLSPYVFPGKDGKMPDQSRAYRAYRYPYDWIPQLDKPEESNVVPPDVLTFRIEGADKGEICEANTVKIKKVE